MHSWCIVLIVLLYMWSWALRLIKVLVALVIVIIKSELDHTFAASKRDPIRKVFFKIRRGGAVTVKKIVKAQPCRTIYTAGRAMRFWQYDYDKSTLQRGSKTGGFSLLVTILLGWPSQDLDHIALPARPIALPEYLLLYHSSRIGNYLLDALITCQLVATGLILFLEDKHFIYWRLKLRDIGTVGLLSFNRS